MRQFSRLALSQRLVRILGVVTLAMLTQLAARAQVSSVSAWDAADFRSWSFIPYWIPVSQVNSFATDRAYDHLSDIVYHSGVQPRADGSLFTGSTAASHLAALKNHQAQFGFRYHLDMYDAVRNSGESAADAVERVWNSISSNPTTRTTFINNVKNVLTANNMSGFNFDWERPNTVTEWGNYTQLAREMQAAFPEHWEVSVDDYGFASSLWDDSPLFDARVYDQIGMMGYHYPANNGTSLDQQSFADGKKALTGQGAEKAFQDSQIIIGMGTWGDNGPATVSLKNIVAVAPNLPPDATSFTGTVQDVNGVSRTGTWDIVSRYEVRDNVQLALDRGMAGVMWWALSYDATNEMSLARVAQHYAMVKRNVPDLNLDGKVNVTDATALANNMGTTTTNTGTATAAQFDAFYLGGNWEKGDRDGNGFVNQADADWLAGRYTALGVSLPDRLAYQGTFENFQNAIGVVGRWKAGRNAQNNLLETGNYTQHGTGFLSWSGTGVGASKRSNYFVTVRNQNAAETTAGVNAQSRTMQADLSTNIDLSQNTETYITFLVRENTSALSAAQLASSNRTLSLDFLNGSGGTEFDFVLRGLTGQFGIESQADAAGQDVNAGGFMGNATYLFVGKISGNGTDANTIQASLFPTGAVVANFTDAGFAWMLTANSSAGYNPTITDLQFITKAEGNFTISNVWTGDATAILPPTLTSQGDFNHDSIVNNADYVMWRNSIGQTGSTLVADGDGNWKIDNDDFNTWRAHYGQSVAASAAAMDAAAGVPEPASLVLLLTSGIFAFGACGGRTRYAMSSRWPINTWWPSRKARGPRAFGALSWTTGKDAGIQFAVLKSAEEIHFVDS
jgi:hypothetical protein